MPYARYPSPNRTAFPSARPYRYLQQPALTLNPLRFPPPAAPTRYNPQVVRRGLNAMMQRFFVEADLMLRDTASAWTLNSTRVDYIYHEGTGNMHWAMYDLTNQHLNRVVGLYMRVEVFHVVVFVLSWLLALVFLFCMLRPFMGKTKVGAWVGGVSGGCCRLAPLGRDAACAPVATQMAHAGLHADALCVRVCLPCEAAFWGAAYSTASGMTHGSVTLASWRCHVSRVTFTPRAQRETERIAEMLSQLPADVDVEGLLNKALVSIKGGCPVYVSHDVTKHSHACRYAWP